MQNKIKIADWNSLEDRTPTHARVSNVDLVIVRYDEDVSVLYGRCLHRGAMLADGFVRGDDLVCGVHNWDYRFRTGVSAYINDDVLQKFGSWIEDGSVLVDEEEILAWEREHPQPYDRDAYQGSYQDPHGTPEEPNNLLIRSLAESPIPDHGHGPVSAMGIAAPELPG